MKILTRFICFLLLAGFLNSCSEDFQLTEPYKDIPVIYGLLNRADTAHYIRIHKTLVNKKIASDCFTLLLLSFTPLTMRV